LGFPPSLITYYDIKINWLIKCFLGHEFDMIVSWLLGNKAAMMVRKTTGLLEKSLKIEF